MGIPETRYARIGDRQVAYQVVGDGPVDVLVTNLPFLPIDVMWEEPSLVDFRDRLASFSRSFWFDAWGGGSSSPLPPSDVLLIESVVADMVGLLDALGCERAAVLDFGNGWAGPLFAATHPERIRALVVDSPIARIRKADDYPMGLLEDEVARRVTAFGTEWGTNLSLRRAAPSVAEDAHFGRWISRCQRLSVTPDEALRRFRAWYEADLRNVLTTIKVPTLVVIHPGHRTTDLSRYVADNIEGARVVELGTDLLFFAGDTRPMLDAIEEFLTGRLPVYDVDRVLATVVFTDVVGSTEHATRMGDRRWRELLATHDTLVRGELVRFRGHEVKSMGDGFLATFDGPGRAVRCACAIRDAVSELGVELRVGVHTGEIELQGDDVGGIAVHIAQRVMADAQPGEVVASSTVRDLVAGSGIVFDDRGL